MTNGERIRSMSDEELNTFLWWFKIDALSAFLSKGGAGLIYCSILHQITKL